MIESNVKIHDRFSFEIKFSLVSDSVGHVEKGEFSINSWIFIPNSLDINRDSYPKEQFFKDLKSNIRLMTPVYSLEELIGNHPESPGQRLSKALRELLEDPASDEKGACFVHQTKLFANICKSAIRNQVNFIISCSDAEALKHTIVFVADLRNILQYFRSLYPLVQSTNFNREWSENFAYADNFISNVAEQHAFRLMKGFRQRKIYDKACRILLPLLESELAERKKRKFPVIHRDNKENNSWVVMQWGILKKLVESGLFLHIKMKKDGAVVEQLLYSIAAGISMLFATVVTFTAQKHYASYTFPLFVILIVSYMFKDRIKDSMRYYFDSQLGKKYFDRKRRLSTRDVVIGEIKESVNYVSEEHLPAEVVAMRRRLPIVEAENKIYNEQILLYKKLVKLSFAKLIEKDGYHYAGINDITKFYLVHLTQKMSNPEIDLYFPDSQKGYICFEGDKVYPLHFIFRGESQGQVFFRKFRLLFNRDGIKELVEM